MTGKTKELTVLGKNMLFMNQRCKEWTHPYAYQDDEDLASAGCGIFSLCHAAEWLTGVRQDPAYWADFSCANGGRGDDGTDRPALLAALMASGDAGKLGFRYDGDGLRNDLDPLFDGLLNGKCVAMCNLRVGHIVALVAARNVDGERQVLAIDSYSESGSDKVKSGVREVIEGTEIDFPIRNERGLEVGHATHYGAFWVKLEQVRDYNMMHVAEVCHE